MDSKRRALTASGAAHDEKTWAGLAELGLTALPVPEALGGFGGGARPAARDAGLRPLALDGAVPGERGARRHRPAPRRRRGDATRLLPGMASGEIVSAWAHDEPAGRHAPLWVETRAERKDGGWKLDGIKSNVPAGGLARYFVVSARIAGAPADANGCALFLVDAKDAGVALREFRLVDDTAAGELVLTQAAAQPLANPEDSTRTRLAIQGTVAAGIAAVCADMSGAAQAAFDLAMDYLRTRKQFGRLIGENQALRHRASEMLVSLEMARSMAMAAAVAADDASAEDSAPTCIARSSPSPATHATWRSARSSFTAASA